MPQVYFPAWSGPSSSRNWQPSLTPQRGSFNEDPALPDEGFKFGYGGPSVSAATNALKNIDLSPSSRSSISSKKKAIDVFEELEAEEAERQRRAFLAATYGEDSKRARERLSFASTASGNAPTTPQGGVRRPSLALWERIHGVRPLEPVTASAGDSQQQSSPEEDFGARRGSVPVAIPGRSPQRDFEELNLSVEDVHGLGEGATTDSTDVSQCDQRLNRY